MNLIERIKNGDTMLGRIRKGKITNARLKEVFSLKRIIDISFIVVNGAIIVFFLGPFLFRYIDLDTKEAEAAPAEIEQMVQQEDTGVRDFGPAEPAAALPETQPAAAEIPELQDFLWYTEDVFQNGVPEDAEILTDRAAADGSWKGMLWYDPDRHLDFQGKEFLEAELLTEGDAITIILDMKVLYEEGEEPLDETANGALEYKGRWREDGGCYAAGTGTVYLDTFFTLPDGRMCAIGAVDAPDGTPTFIALTR